MTCLVLLRTSCSLSTVSLCIDVCPPLSLTSHMVVLTLYDFCDSPHSSWLPVEKEAEQRQEKGELCGTIWYSNLVIWNFWLVSTTSPQFTIQQSSLILLPWSIFPKWSMVMNSVFWGMIIYNLTFLDSAFHSAFSSA